MKYLIKDLSKMTGVKGFTIRKWQERYGIFDPQIASNGYWYYTNEDYIVLTRIINLINKGDRISNVVSKGRDYLLNYKNNEGYSSLEKEIISYIKTNNFENLEKYLNEESKKSSLRHFIRTYLQSLTILVGKGWNDGLLSTADEHAFSRWFSGYLINKTKPIPENSDPVWLITTFPGDTHELGALMYYSLLKSKNIPARFVGALPLEHIIKELNRSNYKAISISMALGQPFSKIEKVKNTIVRKTSVKKVYFGGRGYRIVKELMKKESKS